MYMLKSKRECLEDLNELMSQLEHKMKGISVGYDQATLI